MGVDMERQYQHVEDEIEIDLKELFFELLDNWVKIFVSTVIMAIIAFSVSKFVMTPQYESTAQLYVNTKSTSITNLTDLQASTSLTNDYLVIVTGRPVLEQVITNLGLKEETYLSLSNRVTVNNPSNSRILEITVTDPDPVAAKTIADEIADVSALFIADKMDQDPPSVLQYGYADDEAVSPNVLMNTILGAAVGAVLAMAVIIISRLLNDTIMTPEDVERKLGLHVLGTLPLEESEYDGGKKRGRRKVEKKARNK